MKIYLLLRQVPGFEELKGAASRNKSRQYFLQFLSHWYNWLPFGFMAIPIFTLDWFVRKGYTYFGFKRPMVIEEITSWILLFLLENLYYRIVLFREYAKYSQKNDTSLTQ